MHAASLRKQFFWITILSIALVGAGTSSFAADSKWEVRAQVGPWPVISQVIGYRGRVWFANSVKGRNHNSADLWSLDPESGYVCARSSTGRSGEGRL